jgi:NADH dehydrogenase [ubiquinone] 1 alpha subcomplex assembly factor 7
VLQALDDLAEAEEDVPPLEALRADLIAAEEMSLANYMASCNATYYGTRDPLGADGDFTTAPEISQMFGELIGLWFADIWLRMDKPQVHYVELGPGRGTLAKDALRAMNMVGLNPRVHLVETSLPLRLRQAENLHDPKFHHDLGSIPIDVPLFVVANEFFDALPMHQIVKRATGWYQRNVAFDDNGARPVDGPLVPTEIIPDHLIGAEPGSVIETSPASNRYLGSLAMRIVDQGGAALIIDYGYEGPALGDSFQALKKHAFSDPYTNFGDQDLTGHVDFATLAATAIMQGAKVQGPVGQGQFLNRLGLVERAAALTAVKPERADAIAAERDRLAGADAMGRLFKAMSISHPDWPAGDGF